MGWRRALCVGMIALLMSSVPSRAYGDDVIAVDDKVRIVFSGLVLNRATNTFDTQATITNVSGEVLHAPMALALASITPSGIALANANGQTPTGQPLVAVPLPVDGLSPGGSASPVLLKFSNPSRQRFTFTPSVLVTGKSISVPTSQALIQAALDAGFIDYGTSLIYRAYALFNDPSLPEGFDGVGSDGEDSGFVEEVRLVRDQLPPSVLAALTPFLLRPTDPSSVFGPSPTSATLKFAAAVSSGQRCPTFWFPTEFLLGNFKVWICATADSAADADLSQRVLEAAESLWDSMTKTPPAGMGEPKADCVGDECAGGNGNIDIYILATNQCRVRQGACRQIPGNVLARAIPDAPFSANGAGHLISSGYILVDRQRAAAGSGLKSTLAHEFFHILQFAHNVEAHVRDTGLLIGKRPLFEQSWFYEASATWAEWNYVPDTAAVQVHLPRFTDFQKSNASLGLQATDPKEHTYDSYIWPFFMQQERGGSTPIFQTWVDIEQAADAAGVDDAVDHQLAFADHFRDFAVRNVNLSELFLPGDPIRPRYVDQDTHFPDNTPPVFANHGEIALAAPPITAVSIRPLAAQYDFFGIDDDVRRIVFDFSGLTNAGSLQVDFIVRQHRDLVWKRISPSGPRVEFCRDLADQDVDQMFIVLSNHKVAKPGIVGLRDDTPLTGSYTIERQPICSPWSGTITVVRTIEQHETGAGGSSDFSERQEQTWTLLPETTRVVNMAPDGFIVFEIRATVNVQEDSRLHTVDIEPFCTETDDITINGSATFTSRLTLALFGNGTYTFGGTEALLVPVTRIEHDSGTGIDCNVDRTTVEQFAVAGVDPGIPSDEGVARVDPNNPNVLSGSGTQTFSAPFTEYQTTASWNLTRAPLPVP